MITDADLVILGGGATGLTAAYLAARAGHRVVVLEGAERPGGLLETFKIGEARLEHYYHHFFTHDAEIRWLVNELGIGHALEFLPATMGVFRDNRIWNFNGPADLFRFAPISLVAKARFAASSLFLGKFANWRNWENVSALEWFQRYAGKAATDAIWRPLLQIKFGPYAEEVPVAWMVGRLRQRMSSREGADERLGYLKGSLQVLLDAVLTRLAELGVKIVTGARVQQIRGDSNGVKSVLTSDGEWSGKQFLSTIPTVYLAPLLEGLAPRLAAQLRSLEYFGAVCTILELDAPLSKIYWLNVADGGFPFGGVIEHTNFIPPSEYGGRHVTYLSRYFEGTNELSSMSESAVVERMTAPLNRIYGDDVRRRIRAAHVFRTRTAALVCDRDFSKRVPEARTSLPNFFLATMAHVYPDERSCNNAIRVAAEVCRVMNLETPQVPKGLSLAAQIGM